MPRFESQAGSPKAACTVSSCTRAATRLVLPTPPMPAAVVVLLACWNDPRRAGGAVTAVAFGPDCDCSTRCLRVSMRSGRSTAQSGSVGVSGGKDASERAPGWMAGCGSEFLELRWRVREPALAPERREPERTLSMR
eukprot:984299-Prymnesium_polylepis.2